jgi:hypothetical protein
MLQLPACPRPRRARSAAAGLPTPLTSLPSWPASPSAATPPSISSFSLCGTTHTETWKRFSTSSTSTAALRVNRCPRRAPSPTPTTPRRRSPHKSPPPSPKKGPTDLPNPTRTRPMLHTVGHEEGPFAPLVPVLARLRVGGADLKRMIHSRSETIQGVWTGGTTAFPLPRQSSCTPLSHPHL